MFSIPDKERDYESYMVYVLTIIWTVTIGCIISLEFFLVPESWQRWVLFLGINVVIAAVSLYLNQTAGSQVAGYSLTAMIWLFATIPCFSAGGIMDPGILSQMSVILTAGFLLGWRGGLTVGLLTLITDLGMVYLEVTGDLPEPRVLHTPLSRWVGAIVPFSTILALQYYSTSHLRSGLSALGKEISRREAAEKSKDQTLYELGERVKELKTLFEVSRILRDEDAPQEQLFSSIVKELPLGWQFPDLAVASLFVGDKSFASPDFGVYDHSFCSELKTKKGTLVKIQIAYKNTLPQMEEDPFLKEERRLIEVLVDMITSALDNRERKAELKDFRYALDIAAFVSVAGPDAKFNLVNENFCKISKYSAEELIGQHHDILWSGYHPAEYFFELGNAMANGRPFRGEFCNRAKDGSLYWADSTIVPFLDEEGKIYQFLSINYDITERKLGTEKLRESERLLKKITSQVPGNTYMFEIAADGTNKVLFKSRGTEPFHQTHTAEEESNQSEQFREHLHEDDELKYSQTMKEAHRTGSPISFQYRMVVNNSVRWRWMQAISEKDKDGKIVWYGATSDITSLVEYIASIEQMIFDIGHVIRRPLSTMLSLTKLVQSGELSEKDIREISVHLHQVSEEMDKFIRELNEDYHQKRKNTQLNIDIASLIDNRSSLFE
ncbi:PAS domain-containing protein [Algoriphagus terrigena]|uniref:PAS domain-containing protein n=1 Tax=Algoriphagus terrigena TaxID=344884 RepID=UPI0006862191|nr:PAS domain-containing protein [Algoriphagus terrigena]